MKKKTEFALYKGETFLDIGTREELAKKFNVSVDTITYWSTPSNYKRLANKQGRKGGYSEGIVAVRLDDKIED